MHTKKNDKKSRNNKFPNEFYNLFAKFIRVNGINGFLPAKHEDSKACNANNFHFVYQIGRSLDLLRRIKIHLNAKRTLVHYLLSFTNLKSAKSNVILWMFQNDLI